MHAKTDTKVRQLGFASEARGFDLALDTSISESSGNENATDATEISLSSMLLDVLCIDPLNLKTTVEVSPRMGERFVDTLVGVLQLNVFPHHSNLDFV